MQRKLWWKLADKKIWWQLADKNMVKLSWQIKILWKLANRTIGESWQIQYGDNYIGESWQIKIWWKLTDNWKLADRTRWKLADKTWWKLMQTRLSWKLAEKSLWSIKAHWENNVNSQEHLATGSSVLLEPISLFRSFWWWNWS